MKKIGLFLFFAFALFISGCSEVYYHVPAGHYHTGPGNSEYAPGHDPAGPGNSENAPGHNKKRHVPPGQAKKY